MRWTRSTDGSSSAQSAWPASWKATIRFSCSPSARRACIPATTRSSAASKSGAPIMSACRRAAKIAASLQMFARSAPVSPLVWRATSAEVDARPERLRARVDGQDLLAPAAVRRCDEDLAVEAARAQQRRVELLQQVRGGDHDDVAARVEAVELDEQLVERLVLLARDVGAAAAADRVELVDEDDRRRLLARDLEEAPDPRGAEPGEHLDERGGRLREEVRARLVRRRPSRAASCRCPADRAAGSRAGRLRRASRSA